MKKLLTDKRDSKWNLSFEKEISIRKWFRITLLGYKREQTENLVDFQDAVIMPYNNKIECIVSNFWSGLPWTTNNKILFWLNKLS